MFSVYGRNQIVFNDGTKLIDFQFGANIIDYDDSFVIETQVGIDDIVRGWMGDVRIILTGSEYSDICNPTDNAKDVVLYKDALCYRRIMEFNHPGAAVWKYMFMKY